LKTSFQVLIALHSALVGIHPELRLCKQGRFVSELPVAILTPTLGVGSQFMQMYKIQNPRMAGV
jgi:hypothetical protein